MGSKEEGISNTVADAWRSKQEAIGIFDTQAVESGV
jgi:hypothetical protein